MSATRQPGEMQNGVIVERICFMKNLLHYFSVSQRLSLFFAMIMSYHSYGMLDSVVNVLRPWEPQKFLQKFPSMSFVEANKQYWNCSSAVQQGIRGLLAEKDSANNIFPAVFYMATQVPHDIQNVVVRDILFYQNKVATEKFLNMPIGKALEWYAWCEQASRGHMIYLPVFEKKFKDLELIFYDFHSSAQDTDTSYQIKQIKQCHSHVVYSNQNYLLDQAIADFFQLSRKDIILLLALMCDKKNDEVTASKKDLKRFLKINSKMPMKRFVKRIVFKISLCNSNRYILKNAITKTFLPIFIPMLFSVLYGVYIRNVKIVPLQDNIKENVRLRMINDDYRMINDLIQKSGKDRLLPYMFSYHAMLEEQGHPFVKKIYQYINGLVLITGIVPLLPIGILPDAPRPWYLCLVYMGWFWQSSCEHHIIPFVFLTIVFTLLSVTMEFIKEWLNSYGLRNESVKSSKGESYLENKDIHVL